MWRSGWREGKGERGRRRGEGDEENGWMGKVWDLCSERRAGWVSNALQTPGSCEVLWAVTTEKYNKCVRARVYFIGFIGAALLSDCSYQRNQLIFRMCLCAHITFFLLLYWIFVCVCVCARVSK